MKRLSQKDSLRRWWIWFVLIIAMFLFSDLAQAQYDDSDDDIGDSVTTDVDVLVESSISDGDVLSLGTGSLGAAAIGNCIATKQFSLFIIFKTQGTKLNKWCAAEYLDRQGKHREAALMRCSIKEIRKIYGERNCIGAMIIREQELEPALVGLYNQAAQYDERYEQQQEQQQELEQQFEEQAANYSVLLERIDRKERVDAAAARKLRQQKAEDNVYLRGLVDELKALSQPEGESANDLAKADE